MTEDLFESHSDAKMADLDYTRVNRKILYSEGKGWMRENAHGEIPLVGSHEHPCKI